MFDDEALSGPGMKDARLGKPLVCELRHPVPYHAIFLTAPLERTPPEIENMVAEGREGPAVGRHRVVVEEAADNVLKPLALIGNVGMHAPAQFLLDLLQLRPHAVTSAFPRNEELAVA